MKIKLGERNFWCIGKKKEFKDLKLFKEKNGTKC